MAEREGGKERDVAIVTVVKRPTGSFQVIIPKKKVAIPLRLQGGEQLRVRIDLKQRRWTYEVIK